MAGYEVTIDHRFGGHDGPTEWEIKSRIPVVEDRIWVLKELNHPHLCAFRMHPMCRTFCIREGAPRHVVVFVMMYLTAIGGVEEEEALGFIRSDLIH